MQILLSYRQRVVRVKYLPVATDPCPTGGVYLARLQRWLGVSGARRDGNVQALSLAVSTSGFAM